MAKAAVAVALLSLMLLAGPAFARSLPGAAETGQHRRLLQTFGTASGSASSSGIDPISISDNTGIAGDGFGAAGGFSASAALQPDGQVSFDESNSVGDAISVPGLNQAQSFSGTQGNGVPGSSSSENIAAGAGGNLATGSAGGSSGRRL